MRRLVRAWLRRTPLLPRRVRVALAVACAAGAVAVVAFAPQRSQAQSQRPPSVPPTQTRVDPALAPEGRALFVDGCSSCHGLDARGIKGTAPSLVGVGPGPVDFYLRTGRMPLADPRDQPQRGRPIYQASEISAIASYVASLGGSQQLPRANPAAGSLSQGFSLFTEHCAGCHQVVAQGGLTIEAQVPSLQKSKPTDIAEAVRMGPYLMPKFPPSQINQHQLDSIARYVVYTRDPDDRGGWSIGHIGPIPEGMVAWLLAGAALVLVIRLIGERNEI
ncbi:MAG TPA: c-type cytochrome [Thermoleophilaceae bacterium]